MVNPSSSSSSFLDLRPFPRLFNAKTEASTSAEPSIPCSLFWTFHFCLSINALKGFRAETNSLRDTLVGEIRRHRETMTSLNVMRSKLDGYIWELDMARDKAETESRRCDEAYKVAELIAERLKEESMEESRKRKEAEAEWRWGKETVVKELRGEAEERIEEMEERVEEERRLRKEAEQKLEKMERAKKMGMEERRLRKEAEKMAMEERRLRKEAEKMAMEERRLRKEAEDIGMEERRKRREVEKALKRAVVEYSIEELRCATDSFDEENIIQEDGYGALYKGKCSNLPVSIRILGDSLKYDSQEAQMSFIKQVAFLSRIHHPHIVTLYGACFDKPCVVYEHMANGNLEDYLSNNGGTLLPWHARLKICSEITSALLFLHSLPEHFAHGELKLGSVFLDDNLVCKIGDVGIKNLISDGLDGGNENRKNQESDVRDLSIILLQLLTALPEDGVVHAVNEAMDTNELQDILDDSAGEWPFRETMRLAWLSLQLAEPRINYTNLMAILTEIMKTIRACLDENSANERSTDILSSSEEPPEEQLPPHHFLCPITQEIMENPCIAADGFCYDREHIEAWLRDHSTSPMTNARLNHQNLIPNNSLRAAIQEWTEKQRGS